MAQAASQAYQDFQALQGFLALADFRESQALVGSRAFLAFLAFLVLADFPVHRAFQSTRAFLALVS